MQPWKYSTQEKSKLDVLKYELVLFKPSKMSSFQKKTELKFWNTRFNFIVMHLAIMVLHRIFDS
jgi:hypothetical protein